MKPKKVIAFDLYDTCFEFTLPQANIAYTQLFSSLGLTKQNHRLRKILLTSSKDIEDILLEKFPDLDIHTHLDAYHHDLRDEILSVQLFPETLSVLSALKYRGYRLAAVSNLAQPYVQPLHSLLPHIFDYEILSCNVGFTKPDIKIFDCLKSISWYGSDAILMVGDSLASDIQWAKNASIDAVRIDRSSSWIIYHKDYISLSTLDQLLVLL